MPQCARPRFISAGAEARARLALQTARCKGSRARHSHQASSLGTLNQQRQVSGRSVPRLRRFSNLHDRSQSANGWCGGFLGFHDFDETEAIVLGPDGVEPMTAIASEHERIRGALPTLLLVGDEGRKWNRG